MFQVFSVVKALLRWVLLLVWTIYELKGWHSKMKLAKTLNTKALQRRVLQYTVQEMHAGLINILVSKRLDRWRRDISEKRRKCKKHSCETFSFKTSAQEDGKTKMFNKFSPYFLHFFFQFSPNFPNVKNSNCFHHRSTDVCKHTGKGKTFYSNEFFLCKNTWISCTASASTKETASAVWHTNAFILSGYKGIWCQVCFL